MEEDTMLSQTSEGDLAGFTVRGGKVAAVNILADPEHLFRIDLTSIAV